MTGITDPSEEYFKDGVWVWATSVWKKAVGSAAGLLHVQIAGQEADVEVTQTAPADLQVGLSGYDGSAWRKLALVWGYSARYIEKESETAAVAGTRTLTFTTCPAGVVRVVEGIACYNNTTIATRITIELVVGAAIHVIHVVPSPPIYQAVSLVHPVVMVEDDSLRARFMGTQVGDTIVANAWGYDMDLTN